MSIKTGINEAAGQTKTREASTLLLRGPEHGLRREPRTEEDAVAKALSDKAAVKKLSSTNAKSLNGMKQKLRKHCKQYEDDLARVRKEGVGPVLGIASQASCTASPGSKKSVP